MVRACQAIVQPEADGKNLRLSVLVAPDLPSHILVDPTRLRQILLNFAVNAVKFTNRGGVSILATALGDRLRFEVSDTGIGIAPEVQERLFQDFTQADASTTRRYGGTGLGLAICKRLVTQMGGEIGVRSTLGDGATFWFEIPLRAAPAPARTTPAASAPAVAPQPSGDAPRALRILVAEDVEMNQILARAILEGAGHTVEVAPDGQAALEAVQEAGFDLILMDIQMPVMDGLAATTAIRALGGPAAGTPIWAMTANALAEDVEACLKAGMDGHVAKPLDEALLLRRLQAVGEVEPHQTLQVLDETRAQNLRRLMGEARAIDFADRFRRSLQQALVRIEIAPADVAVVEKEAHNLVSSAGNLGFEVLSDAARQVMIRARAGEDYTALLAALIGAARQALEVGEPLWAPHPQSLAG